MGQFAVTEARTLFFHRLLLAQARQSPDLLERAAAEISKGGGSSQSQRWGELLAGPVAALAEAVLDPGPAGGLLRAHSPMMKVLTDAERNALWQRVGLQQMVAYAQAASADLGLTLTEEATLFGDDATTWHQQPPDMLSVAAMAPLKQIIAIGRSLGILMPNGDERRAWMRTPHAEFGASPMEILLNGGGDILQQAVTEMVRPHLDRAELPSH